MRPGESEWQSDALVGEASEGGLDGRVDSVDSVGGVGGGDGLYGAGVDGGAGGEKDSTPGLTPIPKPYTWRAENLVDYARPLAIMLTSAFATFIMLYF